MKSQSKLQQSFWQNLIMHIFIWRSKKSRITRRILKKKNMEGPHLISSMAGMEVACTVSIPPYSSLTKSQFCLGWQCEQSKWLTFSDSLAAIVSMWLRSNQHDTSTDWKCYYLKSKRRTWGCMSFPFAFIFSSSIERKCCTWKCRNHLVTMRKEDTQ